MGLEREEQRQIESCRFPVGLSMMGKNSRSLILDDLLARRRFKT